MSERTGVLYADSSALMKLVVSEIETDALSDELQQWRDVATSVVTEIELARAVARVRDEGKEAKDDIEVWAITAAALEIELTPTIRRVAANLEPSVLRALDCIHVASALSLGGDLAALLTYDKHMRRAAVANGLEVLAPG